jgi:DNA-binding transcriptional MocR family regulator
MTGDTFTKDKLAWLEAIAADEVLTGAAFRVAIKIATKYLNRKTGDAWPGILTLAADVGLSERSVQRAIRLLEARGWMHIEEGGGGHNSTNRYEIAFAKPYTSMGQRCQNVYSRGAKTCILEVTSLSPKPYEEPAEEPNEGIPHGMVRFWRNDTRNCLSPKSDVSSKRFSQSSMAETSRMIPPSFG